MKTSIQNIQEKKKSNKNNNEDEEQIEKIKNNDITKNDLSELIFDLDNSNLIKLSAINSYYKYYGEEIIEIINKLSCMYLISGILKIEELLNIVILASNLDETLKLECVKCLILKKKSKKNYKLLYDLLYLSSENIPIICQIDAIKLLLLCSDFIKDSLELLINIINNLDLECEYRYKLILSFDNFEDNIPTPFPASPNPLQKINNDEFSNISTMIGKKAEKMEKNDEKMEKNDIGETHHEKNRDDENS